MKQFFAFALLILVVAACKKKNNDDIHFAGTISIDTPAAGDTIHGGNSFFVTGTISANDEMHGYHLTVYNQDDQTVVYENQYHLHASSYVMNEAVTHTLTAATPLRLVVEAASDHEGDALTKEVLFTYEP
jgi:hypothetical protein